MKEDIMHKKNIVITIIVSLIVGVILLLSNMTDKVMAPASSKYQVYLHGEKIGVIDDEEELYNLIDKSQTAS